MRSAEHRSARTGSANAGCWRPTVVFAPHQSGGGPPHSRTLSRLIRLLESRQRPGCDNPPRLPTSSAKSHPIANIILCIINAIRPHREKVVIVRAVNGCKAINIFVAPGIFWTFCRINIRPSPVRQGTVRWWMHQKFQPLCLRRISPAISLEQIQSGSQSAGHICKGSRFLSLNTSMWPENSKISNCRQQ